MGDIWSIQLPSLIFLQQVSGAAYKVSKGVAYYHGTMLIDTDTNNLKYYLTPKQVSVYVHG